MQEMKKNDEQSNEKNSSTKSHEEEFPLPLYALSKLYETMCSQDIDDGTTTKQEIKYFTPQDCLEKLRNIENETSFLKIREQHVLSRGKKLGLLPVDPAKKAFYLGYRYPEDNFDRT